MSLTGNRNTDFTLLVNIPDEKDFLSLCQTNKKAAEICRDNNLFLSRLSKYYPNTLKWKPKTTSWKKYYLGCMYYIGKLKELGFEYTQESTGSPSEYYYFLTMKNNSMRSRQIAKLNFLDLFLFIVKDIPSFFDKIYILKYAPIDFISKYFDEIFQLKDFQYGEIQDIFEIVAEKGRWDLYQFLLTKFPDHPIEWKGRYLASVGQGGNEDIIRYASKKYSPSVGSDVVNLLISLGAYDKLHTEIGNKYFNKIQNLNNLKIIDDAVTYTEQFLLIGVKSGNSILLNKTIEELFAEQNEDGDPLYNGEFVLSFEYSCNEKNLIWCEKLIKLGYPEKEKEELLKILERNILDGKITKKSADKLKFLINTTL